MSSDNGILLNLGTFKVTYFMGDGEIDSWKCKTLEEAVTKAQDLNQEHGGTEYGCSFIGSLKKRKH